MTKAIIIATDNRYLASMCATVRACADEVAVVAIGDQSLKEHAASSGTDRVCWCELSQDVPAEAFGDAVAQWAHSSNPGIVLSNDAPAARAILASVAGALDAAVLGDVVEIKATGAGFSMKCKVAGGIALQEASVAGAVAAIYGGSDFADQACAQAPIELLEAPAGSMRVVERRLPAADAVDLSVASRIVGIGRGVRSSGDLPLVEGLASDLGAAMACTLPVSEDSHWYPPEQVLGSSHNSAAPELYIALGVSGSPNHLSGVKDARVVVAVNNDPDAEVFKRCDYGVVADLYEFVPALRAALA